MVLRPDFLRATSELGMGGESLWRCGDGSFVSCSTPHHTTLRSLAPLSPPSARPPSQRTNHAPKILLRFENMVNMVYGGGEAEEAAAELRAAEATAEGDDGEVRPSVVRKWSFLEDSDDEVRRWSPPPPEQCMRAYYVVCRVPCAVRSCTCTCTPANVHTNILLHAWHESGHGPKPKG